MGKSQGIVLVGLILAGIWLWSRRGGVASAALAPGGILGRNLLPVAPVDIVPNPLMGIGDTLMPENPVVIIPMPPAYAEAQDPRVREIFDFQPPIAVAGPRYATYYNPEARVFESLEIATPLQQQRAGEYPWELVSYVDVQGRFQWGPDWSAEREAAAQAAV